MKERTSLIQIIKATEVIASRIEAINILIPFLTTETLKTKYNTKIVYLSNKYQEKCGELKQQLVSYLKGEPERGNKRSLTLRKLLNSL